MNITRYTVLAIVVCMLFLLSWQSDDSYHGYVMARNLVEGNGFVYYVGERVNASTCPLWTLLCAGVYALCGNMYFGTILLSLFITSTAAAILFTHCRTKRVLYLCAVLFMFSPCSIFGVSGLENSLLYLLSGILTYQLLSQKEGLTRKKLFLIALTVALLAWTRMDIVLIFVPACVFVYLTRRQADISFISSVFIALLGLLPFIGWELFSIFYYGFPFPNTAYAKLSAGLPALFYVKSGIEYTFWSFVTYCAIPIALFSVLYLYRKHTYSKEHLLVLLGTVLYCLYVVYVGGDFMIGRHFSVVLYVCLILIASLFNEQDDVRLPIYRIAAFTIMYTIAAHLLFTPFLFCDANSSLSRKIKRHMRVDPQTQLSFLGSASFSPEITFWGYMNSSLFHINRLKQGLTTDCFTFRSNTASYAPVQLYHTAFGNLTYSMRGTHFIDTYGLFDALIARLPSDTDSPRIGHISRKIPEGYIESLEKGQNCLKDEKLRCYYDHLRYIISGDLWDAQRIKAIYDFNSGKYNELLPKY